MLLISKGRKLGLLEDLVEEREEQNQARSEE
jgi:hypothetical protein